MPLPVFDLAETMAAYNRVHHSHYALDRNFGFRFLSKKMLTYTNTAIFVVNSGIDRYDRTPREKAFFEKRKRFYARWQNSVFSATVPPNAEEDPKFAQHYRKKWEFIRWHDEGVMQLSKPQTWDTWLGKAASIHKSRLRALKTEWEKGTAFANHTHASLVFTAQELLPALIDHHQRAARWLPWFFWMPREIRLRYKNYLNIFSQEAEQTKTALAAQLLRRLQVWEQEPTTEGHVLVYWHRELKKMGAIPEEEKSPPPYECFTAKEFSVFHHIIERYGDAETRRQLRNLSWFSQEQKQSTCPTRYVKTTSSVFLVPEHFMASVPQVSRKPAWLFPGHHFRHRFFETRSLVLVLLKTFPEVDRLTVNLCDLSPIEIALNNLLQKQQAIHQELHQLQKVSYTEWSWFQRHTQEFIQEWRSYLLGYRTKILENQLKIVEKVAVSLQQLSPLNAVLQAWPVCRFINQWMKRLRREFKAHPNAALQQRLSNLEEKFIYTLSTYRILRLIQQVARGEILSQEKRNYLLEVTKIIGLNDKKNYTCFQELCQGQWIEIRKRFNDEIKGNSRESPDPERQAYRLLQFHQVLEQCSDELTRKEHQQRIVSQLPQYFLKYLETVLRCGSVRGFVTRYRKTLAAAEQVILALDPGLLFAGKTLSVHIQELQKLGALAVENKNRWIFMHARCQALVHELLPSYLEKRVKKDVATFDRQLFHFIQTDVELPYQENTVQEIRKISDQHIAEEDLKIEALLQFPEQKTITGFNGGKSAYILELLELRKGVYRQQNRILTERASLQEKSQWMQTLADDLQGGLQKNSRHSVGAWIGSTASGRHTLFAKTYFDTQLLGEQKPSPSEFIF